MVRALLIVWCLMCSASAQFSPFSPFATKRISSSALLIDENFEGTGTPSGWTVDDPDGVSFDNTSVPLSGAEDLGMSDAVDPSITVPFTASSEVWITFEWKYSGVPPAACNFLYVQNTGGSKYMGVFMNTGGTIGMVQTGGGAVGTATTDAFAGATKVYFFVHAVKGTGANAVYDVEFNTSNSRTGSGNKFTSYASGTVNEDFSNLNLYRSDAQWGTRTWQMDNLKVSHTGWPP